MTWTLLETINSSDQVCVTSSAAKQLLSIKASLLEIANPNSEINVKSLSLAITHLLDSTNKRYHL
jgi:hypothetical protein